MNRYDWVTGEFSPTSPEALSLAGKCRINPSTAALALSRGITSAEEFEKFHNKSPDDLLSPFLMKDMKKAVERIKLALSSGEHITVYGDYDVDGITSVSALVIYLREKGAKNGCAVDYYIPDRSEEGYGINKGALCSLFEGGTSLLITVDTGITACDEIEAISELGMDVVVTDHHQCKSTVPNCSAVVNPTQPDCTYPFKHLAGVGVVFKLISALEGGNQRKVLSMFGDLVALGTIADVVSLVGENRIIVEHGLKLIGQGKNIGLAALTKATELGEKVATVSGISFGIAPKINAAGRVGDASLGVDLLLSENEEEAMEISMELLEQNRRRQDFEKDIYNEVTEKIGKDKAFEQKPVLVIWGYGWHGGVIGIVSSKISEKYSKPCILITVENGIAKGSGRSIEGFDLFEAMQSCGDIFIKFGGHSLAAGLTLPEDKLCEFDRLINEYAEKVILSGGRKPVLNIDFELPPNFINSSVASESELFEPCGAGNPTPVFSVSDCKIVNVKALSEGKHLRLSLQKKDSYIDAISFGSGDDLECLAPGICIDIAGNLGINTWNGISRVQFVVRDFKYSVLPEAEQCIPSREDFALCYSYFVKKSAKGFCRVSKPLAVREINAAAPGSFDEEKFELCVKVFTELAILNYVENGDWFDIYISRDRGEKKDLYTSEILKSYINERGAK